MITRRKSGSKEMTWPNPITEIERLSREMDQLTRALWGGTEGRLSSAGVFPLLNISEDLNKYYIRAELPGVKADDLILQVHVKRLTLSGERKISSEDAKAKYHRREREAGNFSRIIELPGEFNTEKVDAKIIDGLLTIVLEKAEKAKPKQIKVK